MRRLGLRRFGRFWAMDMSFWRHGLGEIFEYREQNTIRGYVASFEVEMS
jgi:hypothetical protein